MTETKIEFLLKKILYYTSRIVNRDFAQYSRDLDTAFEEIKKQVEVPLVEKEEAPIKANFEVAPLNLTKDEDLEVVKLKVFDYMKRYGFSSITIGNLKTKRFVKTNDEGEMLFAYFFKEKLGTIERKLYRGLPVVKFVFKEEIRQAVYGKGKG